MDAFASCYFPIFQIRGILTTLPILGIIVILLILRTLVLIAIFKIPKKFVIRILLGILGFLRDYSCAPFLSWKSM